MPWGGAFGTPGPDAGYALKIIREADLEERTDALEKVLAALMGARASILGRAPTGEDLTVALIVSGLSPNSSGALIDRGRQWIAATAHEQSPGRSAVAALDPDLLRHKPEDVRRRLRMVGE
jgi:hypothetical protein